MIMVIKISYYDVLRVNKTIFAKNSTLFISLENKTRSVFGYQDYEFKISKLLLLSLEVQQMDFDKKTGSVALKIKDVGFYDI